MNKTLIQEVTKLRTSLIILTLIQVGYLIILFLNSELLITLNNEYKLYGLVWGANIIVMAICIWFNWQKLPIAKKTKRNNTFMIMFLGIIGMWLWIPNQREINEMINSSLHEN